MGGTALALRYEPDAATEALTRLGASLPWRPIGRNWLEAAEAQLRLVQRRTRARRLDRSDLEYAVERYVLVLDALRDAAIPPVTLVVTSHCGEAVANCYRGVAESTWVHVRSHATQSLDRGVEVSRGPTPKAPRGQCGWHTRIVATYADRYPDLDQLPTVDCVVPSREDQRLVAWRW